MLNKNIIEAATQHWEPFDQLPRAPANEQEYDEKVEALERLLDVAGEDENHPFSYRSSW